MARLVKHEGTAPIKIDPTLQPGQTPPAPNVVPWPRDEAGNLKPVFVCTCGISGKLPFCDGTHKACKTEEPGHVYVYDPATKQIVDKRPD